MHKHSRRSFLRLSAAAGAGLVSGLPGRASSKTNRLGMFVNLGNEPESAIRQVHALGLSACEVYTENFEPAMGVRLTRALDSSGIEATALFTMGPGPLKWDFYEGPLTNGLVPREWRRQRIDRLKQASDFAKRCNIPALETHCGFIPENPNLDLYKETVEAVREVTSHCKTNNQVFLYHAGQETPVTLLRIIQDVGLDNQGVGLDTANPVMYGTGNPVDALDVYGKYLRAVNAKDGLFPTDPRNLGKEVPIGQGKVDFPRFIKRLKEIGYSGPVIIEREISGAQQIEDIKKAKVYLEKLMAEG